MIFGGQLTALYLLRYLGRHLQVLMRRAGLVGLPGVRGHFPNFWPQTLSIVRLELPELNIDPHLLTSKVEQNYILGHY